MEAVSSCSKNIVMGVGSSVGVRAKTLGWHAVVVIGCFA